MATKIGDMLWKLLGLSETKGKDDEEKRKQKEMLERRAREEDPNVRAERSMRKAFGKEIKK